MRDYLRANPLLEKRQEWQGPVNREAKINADYDFDFGSLGPNHIRWGLHFVRHQ